jgi:hypothetical protein
MAQLEAIIAQTKVKPSKRPAFLGKAAAVMLVALGASSFTAPAQVRVERGDRADGRPGFCTGQSTRQPADLCSGRGA